MERMVFRAVVGARPDLRTAQQNYVNMRKHIAISTVVTA
jgi:hypothetical protein